MLLLSFWLAFLSTPPPRDWFKTGIYVRAFPEAISMSAGTTHCTLYEAAYTRGAFQCVLLGLGDSTAVWRELLKTFQILVIQARAKKKHKRSYIPT